MPECLALATQHIMMFVLALARGLDERPLWQMPNVLITPHIAVKDAENISERHFEVFLENARRFAEGTPLLNVVNKAMWY